MATACSKDETSQCDEFQRLDSFRVHHLASKSEPNLVSRFSSASADSSDSALWNLVRYQPSDLQESERHRAASQIAALEEELLSTELELETSKQETAKAKSEVQRVIEKRRSDWESAVEYAKRQLTHNGWDAEIRGILLQAQTKNDRIQELETEVAISKLAICAQDNTIESFKPTNKDFKLAAFTHEAEFGLCPNNRNHILFEEWAIQIRIARCVITIAAGNFEDARNHASEAIKRASTSEDHALVAECYYWHGIALLRDGSCRQAAESLHRAAMCPKGRGKEIEGLLKDIASRNKDQPPTPWPKTPLIKGSKDLKKSASNGAPIASRPYPHIVAKPNNIRQHKPSRLDLESLAANCETSPAVPQTLTHSATGDLLNGGQDEVDESDCLTPRASRSFRIDSDHLESQQSLQGEIDPESSAEPPLTSRRTDFKPGHFRSLSETPSLTSDNASDDSVSSSMESSNEPQCQPFNEASMDGQTFASIDELIGPHVVDTDHLEGTTSPVDSPGSTDSNPSYYDSRSLAARRSANMKVLHLNIPDQHRHAIPPLSQLPSGGRTAFPRPARESEASPFQSPWPEKYHWSHVKRTASLG